MATYLLSQGSENSITERERDDEVDFTVNLASSTGRSAGSISSLLCDVTHSTNDLAGGFGSMDARTTTAETVASRERLIDNSYDRRQRR